MPLFGQAMQRAFACNRQPMQLATESHRKVTDIDHFLNFTQRFLGNLSYLPGNQSGQIHLAFAKPITDSPDKLTPLRGGYHSPGHKRRLGCRQHPRNLGNRSDLD